MSVIFNRKNSADFGCELRILNLNAEIRKELNFVQKLSDHASIFWQKGILICT